MEKELPWYSAKFNKPIKGGKLTQYAKLIIFAYQHKDQEFSRFDLLKQSGVLSDLNIKGFETGEVTRTYTMEGWEPNSYITTHTGNTPTSRCRGFDICLTAGLRALGLLEYNTKTKKCCIYQTRYVQHFFISVDIFQR